MERYYINKIKSLESKLKCNTDDVPCILAYATLPNKKIKANLEILRYYNQI